MTEINSLQSTTFQPSGAGSTWSSGCPLLEVAELGAVPSNVAHVAALETAAVLGLPLVLLRVLVLVVLLLLHSAQKNKVEEQQSPGQCGSAVRTSGKAIKRGSFSTLCRVDKQEHCSQGRWPTAN